MDDPRNQTRKQWPESVRDPSEKVGITPYETVETILPKINALGFRVVGMNIDRGGMLSARPLYHAEVVDPRREDGVLGEHRSATDFAEALAWATAMVIRENEYADRQKREATGPARFQIREFGPTAGEAIYKACPDYEDRVAATVVANGEVVAEVSASYRRTLGLGWNDHEETEFRAAIVDNARAFASSKGLGPIRVVLDPWTEGETDIGG